MEPEPSTSCPPPQQQPQDLNLKTGINALYQGKRHLLVKDVPMALTALADACKVLDGVSGTFSVHSGEAHFYYGKALLEQSRLEMGIFEDIIEEVDEEEEEEDDEEVDDVDEEAAKEEVLDKGTEGIKMDVTDQNVAEVESPVKAAEEDITVQDVVTDTTVKAPEGVILCSAANGSIDVSEPTPSTSTCKPAETSEDPNTLELAWEVLEVAKLSYTRAISALTSSSDQSDLNTLKKRLAEVHLVLGEVATESEQYQQAIQDYNTALALLESLEVQDKREISQCLFQLGLAYVYDKAFDEGVKAYKRAKELIEERIKELQDTIKSGRTKKELGFDVEDDYSEIGEIAELKALLPELEEKITDTLDTEKEEAKAAVANGVEATNGSQIKSGLFTVQNGSNGSSGSATPELVVNDISHLVRRKPVVAVEDAAAGGGGKRKAEDAEEPAGKRVCMDEPELKLED